MRGRHSPSLYRCRGATGIPLLIYSLSAISLSTVSCMVFDRRARCTVASPARAMPHHGLPLLEPQCSPHCSWGLLRGRHKHPYTCTHIHTHLSPTSTPRFTPTSTHNLLSTGDDSRPRSQLSTRAPPADPPTSWAPLLDFPPPLLPLPSSPPLLPIPVSPGDKAAFRSQIDPIREAAPPGLRFVLVTATLPQHTLALVRWVQQGGQ